MTRRALYALFPVGILMAYGFSGSPSRADQNLSATDFLKQSMSRYQALESFQARCTWRAVISGTTGQDAVSGISCVRTIQYVKPNYYRIVSDQAGKSKLTSVCDGIHVTEYSNAQNRDAIVYAPPASIAEAKSIQMGHPMLSASLLYQFFGGPNNFSQLVDTRKGPVSYGKDVTIAGEPCKSVLFYAAGHVFGDAVVAISARDNLVRCIVYDSAPMMAAMDSANFQKQFQKMTHGSAAIKKTAKPTESTTSEVYYKIITDQPISASAFMADLPAGVKVTVMPGAPNFSPPVHLGGSAPEISVRGLNNQKPVKLSSRRGQVVLLNFWATQSPPCAKSLPEIQRLFNKFGKRGLSIMAIDDELAQPISAYIKAFNYTFPAYRDLNSTARRLYNITDVPTTVIIDRRGRLSAYLVGLQSPGKILAALKKAGLQTGGGTAGSPRL